jgi:hypothetical protein
MFIPTFEGGRPLPDNQTAVFAQTSSQIVDSAIAGGHTKLIIDLSANGGGEISRAFDLFKLFFPSKFPYSATRFRRHESSDLFVQLFKNDNQTSSLLNPFALQAQVNPAQDGRFTSVDELLEGEIQLGIKVTSLYANFNYTRLSRERGAIRGYGGVPINDTQPYRSNDILIITDGTCASTCATFVNLMTNVGGVRALTFGGRHRSEPMQVMGGVRGAQVFKWSQLDWASNLFWKYLEDSTDSQGRPPLLSRGEVDRVSTLLPPGIGNLPFMLGAGGGGDGGVNLRNAYQEGDDHLPLQFQYQASDCRLFYTFQNVKEPSSMWADAKAAVLGDRGCAKNSTGGKGSLLYRNRADGISSGNPDNRASIIRLAGSAGSLSLVLNLVCLVILT